MAFECRAAVFRRRLWLVALAFGLFVFTLITLEKDTLPFSPVWLSLGLAALLVGHRRYLLRKLPNRVRAGAEGVFADGRLLTTLADITTVTPLVVNGRHYVQVRGRHAFSLAVADEAKQLGLLNAMTGPRFAPMPGRIGFGVDLRQMAVTLVGAFIWGVLTAIFLQEPLTRFSPWVLQAVTFGPLALWTGAVIRGSGRVDLGADGLRLSFPIGRYLGLRDEYIPYSALVDLRLETRVLILVTTKGHPRHLRFRSTGAAEVARAAIAQARAAASNPTTSGTTVALARGQKDLAEWIASLRELGAGATAQYRAGAVTGEQLRAIVEQAVAPAATRIAAAIALSSAEGEAVNKEIETIARRTGDRCVERGLTRIASGSDDAELAAALEEAELEDRRRLAG